MRANVPVSPRAAEGLPVYNAGAMRPEGALQQEKFPAFVITPGADKYYRVRFGPYADTQSATNARHDLEAKGFKSIVKR